MSEFEQKFNSAGMRKWRFPIMFVALILIGFLGYYFSQPMIWVVGAVILFVIFLVERGMRK